MKRPKTFTAVVTVVVVVVVAVVFGLIFIYSGVYDVAATRPHTALMRWVLSTTMDESVEHHARNVVVPSGFDQIDPANGIGHYREMCVTCHGAPGVEKGEIGQGLNPEPPDLQEAAADWSPAELYWIIRSGVKMSGMPGFGGTHTEEQLWAITALVHRLPGMTADEYKSLAGTHASPDHEADEHDHQHEGD
jgi:mono/diheme cytochrome c family protein